MSKSIYFLILIFEVVCNATFAGQYSPNYKVDSLIIGWKANGKDSIKGKCYTFDNPIFNYAIDSGTSNLYVVTRKVRGDNYLNKGHVALINMNDNFLTWKKKTNAFKLLSTPKTLILTSNGITKYLDKKSGHSIWWNDEKNQFYNEKCKIVFNDFSRAFDINNGKLKWEHFINNSFGINDSRIVDDSLFVVATSGLHLINLKNGHGWDYNMKTGYSKNNINPGLIAGAIVVGVLTGFVMIPGNNELITHNLSSNILINEKAIYYSSANEMVSLNYSGGFNWKESINADSSGFARLYNFKDKIIRLNTGYASKNNQRVYYGLASISMYDKKNGFVYSKYLKTEKIVERLKIKNDAAYYIVNNTVVQFDIEKGIIAGEIVIDESNEDKGWRFADNEMIYISDKLNNSNFSKLDSNNVILVDTELNLMEITPDMLLVKNISKENVYLFHRSFKEFTFLNKDEKSFLIDEANKKIATFNFKSPILDGNLIGFCYDKKLTIIPFEEFLKK